MQTGKQETGYSEKYEGTDFEQTTLPDNIKMYNYNGVAGAPDDNFYIVGMDVRIKDSATDNTYYIIKNSGTGTMYYGTYNGGQ